MNSGTWAELRKSVPHLIQLVPTEIASIFEKAERTFRTISALALFLNNLYAKANLHASEKLGFPPNPENAQPLFRIVSGNTAIEHVYLGRLWASGKTLKDFSEEIVQGRYPGIEWELELWISSKKVGDHNIALRFAGAAEKFLYQQPRAVEIHKKYREMEGLGKQARELIKEELNRLVLLRT